MLRDDRSAIRFTSKMIATGDFSWCRAECLHGGWRRLRDFNIWPRLQHIRGLREFLYGPLSLLTARGAHRTYDFHRIQNRNRWQRGNRESRRIGSWIVSMHL